MSKEKLAATILRIIDITHIRRGTEKYAQENNTYGATTLRKRHVTVSGNNVTFDFIGKKSKPFKATFNMPEVAPIIQKLLSKGKPDDRLFDIPENSANVYLKKYGVTPKDFRAYSASRIFAERSAMYDGSTPKKRKKSLIMAVKDAAEALNNTPAVCKSSYIDPVCIQAFLDGNPLGVAYAKSLAGQCTKEQHFNSYLDHLAELYHMGDII